MFLPANKSLVLGSQSPRRRQLLEQMGYTFRCLSADVDEENHPNLAPAALAEHLAQKKADALMSQLKQNEILITADTIVWCKGQSLAKAKNESEAKAMLQMLSGGSHQVISGLCIADAHKKVLLHDTVFVHFANLSQAVIEHYIKQYQPFDKAGAYGIQEWIGLVGIEKIEGSYFSVMGLPTQQLFNALSQW